jgi:hypothetical protein
MASTISKNARASEGGAQRPGHLLAKLGKLFHIPALGGHGDDPVCLSALDTTTLGRYGYNESQITLMKEGTLR